MSSIDDHANGATQIRPHGTTVDERGQVVRLVCAYARDADDARQLCAALGLNPRDGRRNTTSQRPSIPGRPSIRVLLPTLGGRPVPPAPQNTSRP